jgi:hypothetical protein
LISVEQKYSSARSSLKQVPAGFGIVDKYFGWKPGTVNFDIGGGKYDLMTEKLKERGVKNLVYDPYNRCQTHNMVVTNQVIFNNGVDTVTIFNVLNVIEETEIQLNVVKMAHNALKTGGMAFVRSTYMNLTKTSGVTKSGTFQHYLTQKQYLEIVKQVFPDAVLKHGIIFARK